MAESIGTVRVDIIGNAEDLKVEVQRAKGLVASMGPEFEKSFQKMTAAQKNATLAALKFEQGIGKSREEVRLLSLAARGAAPEALERVRQKLLATSTAGDGMAKTSKEMQFAMRGMPAQLTDVFTSLAAGQNPMMVFLQQGGQMKDMFGGIGPAARALGASIAGMINPITITAAAVGTLALAWHQAEGRMAAFNKAIIQTGNFAGVTAGEMAELAEQMDAIEGVTRGSSSAALAQVAATGRFTAEQLELVAVTAEKMRVATGTAIDDTVSKFREIEKDPVEALLKLNDAEHFLTQAQIDRVRALEDEGREQEAVTEALRIYADVADRRFDQLIANMSLMSGLWSELKEQAGEFWDVVVEGAGDADSAVKDWLSRFDEMSTIQQTLARALATGAGTALLPGGGAAAQWALDRGVEVANREPAVNDPVNAVDSDAVRKQIEDEKELADLREQWNDDRLRYASDVERMESEILQAKADGIALDLDRALIEERVAAIRKKYADKEKKERQKRDPSEGIVSRLQRQLALNAEQLTSEEKLTTSQRLRIQVQLELEKISGKLTATRRAEIDTLLQQLEVSGAAIKAREDEAQLTEELTRLTNQLNAAEQNRRAENAADLATIGRGREEVEQLRRKIDLQREYEQGLQQLRDSGIASDSESYRRQEAMLREHLQRQLDAEDAYQQARQTMMGDWRNGANAALEDYVAGAKDIAGQTYDLFSNTFQGLEDAAVGFAKGSEEAFGDMLDSIYEEALRFVTRQAIRQMLEAIGGMGGSGITTATADNGFQFEQQGGGSWWNTALSMFSSWFSSSGRAIGGPVSSGRMYEVTEKGQPELLRINGKQWLIPPASGQVSTMGAGGAGGGSTITQTFVIQGRLDQRTESQIAQRAGAETQRALARNR